MSGAEPSPAHRIMVRWAGDGSAPQNRPVYPHGERTSLSVSIKIHLYNLAFIDKFCCIPDLLLLFRNKSGIILYRHILVLHKQLQSQSPKGGEKHHEQI